MDEYLDTAYKATDQLLFLVNDLLDISRIESGRITLHIEPLVLRDLITETGKFFEETMRAKNLNFKIEADPTLKANGDAPHVREVLNNFISNAVKYTPTGEIVERLDDDGTNITCSVSDTGTGIQPEDIPKLFEKFSRVNGSNKETAMVEGTGLGLYIVKKLVELMGGKVGVESTLGKGSRFWFTLPKSS
jgi:signal transduction histidine kinase